MITTPGRLLYEKHRKHDTDAEPWMYLDQESRDFWERMAVAFKKEGIRV